MHVQLSGNYSLCCLTRPHLILIESDGVKAETKKSQACFKIM